MEALADAVVDVEEEAGEVRQGAEEGAEAVVRIAKTKINMLSHSYLSRRRLW